MSVTNTRVTAVGNCVFGDRRVTQTDVVFDSSYPTGGESLTASDLGLTYVDFAIAKVKVNGTGSVVNVTYDIANKKLIAYTAAAEVADTTDISAVTATVTAFGK